jgi:hypothetical protein
MNLNLCANAKNLTPVPFLRKEGGALLLLSPAKEVKEARRMREV